MEAVESAVSRHHGEKGTALVLGSGGGHSAFMLTRTFQKASSHWDMCRNLIVIHKPANVPWLTDSLSKYCYKS